MDLVGAPFDAFGHKEGSRLGPASLRLAGLGHGLRRLGYDVRDRGDLDIEGPPEEDGAPSTAAIAYYRRLRTTVAESLRAGCLPIVLGGDHSVAIGSVAGALEAFGRDLGLLWVDAHADVHTPDTSRSKNLHGMPVAAILGLPANAEGRFGARWAEIRESVFERRGLGADRVAWIGLRDVDVDERPHLDLPEAFVSTMHDVDAHGITRVVEALDRWLTLRGARRLWVSFDVDVLDPILAPGTGTAVRGGLTYREAHLMAELLHEHLSRSECPYRLAGLDVVETNPLEDRGNQTAKMAVEWIESLLGKTILGGLRRGTPIP